MKDTSKDVSFLYYQSLYSLTGWTVNKKSDFYLIYEIVKGDQVKYDKFSLISRSSNLTRFFVCFGLKLKLLDRTIRKLLYHVKTPWRIPIGHPEWTVTSPSLRKCKFGFYLHSKTHYLLSDKNLSWTLYFRLLFLYFT